MVEAKYVGRAALLAWGHTGGGEWCQGGVAGGFPPHKGGRLRPTAHNCSGKFFAVSGAWREGFCRGHLGLPVDCGLAVTEN